MIKLSSQLAKGYMIAIGLDDDEIAVLRDGKAIDVPCAALNLTGHGLFDKHCYVIWSPKGQDGVMVEPKGRLDTAFIVGLSARALEELRKQPVEVLAQYRKRPFAFYVFHQANAQAVVDDMKKNGLLGAQPRVTGNPELN